MNPTYVNRQKLIKHFKLLEEKEKEREREKDIKLGDRSIVVQEDIIKEDIFDEDLSIDIKAVLPVLEYRVKREENFENYTYKLGQVLEKDRVNTRTHKEIHLCIFNIIESPKVPPFVLYLLNKDASTNILYFPHFTTTNNIMDEARNNIDKIFKDWSNLPQHKGFLETKQNIYIFYEQKYQHVLEKINYNDIWWWGSIYEIVNSRMVLNFPVDKTVSSIFYKNPLLISLFKNNNRLSIPYIGYLGGYYTYITFAAAFGIPKRPPTSNLGPYYYFGDYNSAGRWAIWSYTRKEQIIDNEIITANEYGVYKQGGIARYAFLGHNMKYFLNREEDVEDDSKISQDLAKDNEFYRETLKVRDVAGKWANNHDIAFIDFSKYKKYGARRNNIQFAIRDFYQQVPLSYHYVDTSEFINIKDANEQEQSPYNYKTYNIA